VGKEYRGDGEVSRLVGFGRRGARGRGGTDEGSKRWEGIFRDDRIADLFINGPKVSVRNLSKARGAAGAVQTGKRKGIASQRKIAEVTPNKPARKREGRGEGNLGR